MKKKKNCGGTRQSSWKEFIRVGELDPQKSQINTYLFILVIALKTHSITKRQRRINNSRITENNMLIHSSRLAR